MRLIAIGLLVIAVIIWQGDEAKKAQHKCATSSDVSEDVCNYALR